MGQHKRNLTAMAAKAGKLPPKPRRMSSAEQRALLLREINRITGMDKLRRMMGGKYE